MLQHLIIAWLHILCTPGLFSLALTRPSALSHDPTHATQRRLQIWLKDSFIQPPHPPPTHTKTLNMQGMRNTHLKPACDTQGPSCSPAPYTPMQIRSTDLNVFHGHERGSAQLTCPSMGEADDSCCALAGLEADLKPTLGPVSRASSHSLGFTNLPLLLSIPRDGLAPFLECNSSCMLRFFDISQGDSGCLDASTYAIPRSAVRSQAGVGCGSDQGNVGCFLGWSVRRGCWGHSW